MPRLTAWYADPGAAYTYSGLRNDPLPWTPELAELRDAVAARLDHRFNSVLLNRYRSGDDGVSWHSDDERELGGEPLIASLSFGATRRFLLRDRSTRKLAASLPLEHGSLLVMRGRSQRDFQHCVPKDPRATGERINLTFRTILPGR
jgi:alkylated DNA repair dioxygenase AlkB